MEKNRIHKNQPQIMIDRMKQAYIAYLLISSNLSPNIKLTATGEKMAIVRITEL